MVHLLHNTPVSVVCFRIATWFQRLWEEAWATEVVVAPLHTDGFSSAVYPPRCSVWMQLRRVGWYEQLRQLAADGSTEAHQRWVSVSHRLATRLWCSWWCDLLGLENDFEEKQQEDQNSVSSIDWPPIQSVTKLWLNGQSDVAHFKKKKKKTWNIRVLNRQDTVFMMCFEIES